MMFWGEMGTQTDGPVPPGILSSILTQEIPDVMPGYRKAIKLVHNADYANPSCVFLSTFQIEPVAVPGRHFTTV